MYHSMEPHWQPHSNPLNTMGTVKRNSDNQPKHPDGNQLKMIQNILSIKTALPQTTSYPLDNGVC